MKDYRAHFQGKKITVMGLGLLGRGVGDTAFLAECGADIIVTDLKSKEVLAPSVEKLAQYTNIAYILGEHREEDFKGRDVILKSAGVPSTSKYIDIARGDGAEIAMSGALFARLSGIPIIGVTGTRGKSTVTGMIHHVLAQATEGAPVLLGGNVRGVSNLQLLNEVQEDSLMVMELDSWQLQGFGEYKISPQVAVFTNFMEDHMNYYQGDMDAYFADKAHIFMHQEESGVFVTTQKVFERAKKFAQKTYVTLGQEVQLVDSSILPDDCLLSQPGEHNRLNAALATEALRAVGLTDEEIFEGLATFPGVPGRLEYLGEKDGIKIYNDNNATTPSATMAGIEALAHEKNIILITGGAYKEVNPAPLIAPMQAHCKYVSFLPGTGTDTLMSQLTDIPFEWNISKGISGREVLENAITTALAVGERGDVLLFSPAFASFGMFKNEYDRNDQFVEIIQEALAND